EVGIGVNRIVYRSSAGAADARATTAAEPPPELTRRERDLLVALCRPLRGPDPFAQPASIRMLADALVVSEAAVKFHLRNLYDKFAIYEGSGPRRVRLANEAVRRRAVSLSELDQRAD